MATGSEATGEDPYELKYQHFSIVMNASRRTVVREGRKKDSFTPRGDGTHTLPMWTHDQLIKNADGTYRLIRKPSRITQHFNTQGRLVRITDRNDNS